MNSRELGSASLLPSSTLAGWRLTLVLYGGGKKTVKSFLIALRGVLEAKLAYQIRSTALNWNSQSKTANCIYLFSIVCSVNQAKRHLLVIHEYFKTSVYLKELLKNCMPWHNTNTRNYAMFMGGKEKWMLNLYLFRSQPGTHLFLWYLWMSWSGKHRIL